MQNYANPNRIDQLKGLHFKAAYALDVLQICKKNNRLNASCKQLEEEYAEAVKAIAEIHEEAAEQHREWLESEFGDEVREERAQRIKNREQETIFS